MSDVSRAKRVGFLADTHSMKNDGSDLPSAVLDAFGGVDLIVHLGDIGKKAILDRLAAVAPVLVPIGGNKGYVFHGAPADVASAARVVDVNTVAVGLWFNLAQPDKKIEVRDDGVVFGVDPFDKLMTRRFKKPVDVVAFAGTHRPLQQRHEGVLFFNPGSPTLPMEGTPASVAILDVAAEPSVELVSLS